MTAMLIVGLVALLGAGFYFLRAKPVALAVLVSVCVVPLAFGSPGTSLVLTALALAVLLAQPLYVLLGAVSLVGYQYLSDLPPADYGIFPEKIFELTDKNVLLAIPFFVVSGAIMTHGSIARRLVDFAAALTNWQPGGLAVAALGGCMMFAAISGSSPVTVIAIGSMMYPALLKAGFPDRLSSGLLTAAGSLGILIPPSIPMVLYAISVSGRQVVDVGELFLAGVGPGLLIGALLWAYLTAVALKRSSARKADLRRLMKGLAVLAIPIAVGSLSTLALGGAGHLVTLAGLLALALVRAWRQFIDGFWALLLPGVILGGIYTGFFTPTEAAAVSVVYALVVELFIHRDLRFAKLPDVIVDSAVMMGALIVIMVIAFVFNDFLVEAKVPEQAVALLRDLDLSPMAFLLALNIFLLIVGCFMDIMSAILIIAPLVVPMGAAMGVDPVHMGIIFIVNLEVGYLTPPIGLNLFVASTLFRKPVGEIVRAVMPFTVVMIAGVLLVTYLPSIALAPGRWLRGLNEPAKKVLSIEELMRQAEEHEGEPEPKTDPGK